MQFFITTAYKYTTLMHKNAYAQEHSTGLWLPMHFNTRIVLLHSTTLLLQSAQQSYTSFCNTEAEAFFK